PHERDRKPEPSAKREQRDDGEHARREISVGNGLREVARQRGPGTDVTRTVAPIGRSAWKKVSAVNAVVRSTDFSHGQTNHHATRPKTTKEKKVWIPKIANAST